MATLLRFDGLYVSAPKKLKDGSAYREYLRFYPDGAVVIASVTDPSNAEMVARWLHPELPGHPRGRYSTEEDILRFTAVIPESVDYRDGTVEPEIRFEYDGVILHDRLRLTFYPPNRAATTEEYRFCPVP